MSFPFVTALTEPAVLTESSTKAYPLGTRGELEDGRMFRYCRFDSSGNPVGGRLCFDNRTMTYCPGLSIYSTCASGDDHIHLTTATAFEKDFFEDGYAGGVQTGGFATTYKIKSNDLGNTTYLTIYLYTPLKGAVTAGLGVYPSPWGNVQGGNNLGNQQYKTAIGVALVSVTASYYAWIQTKGPVFIASCIGGASGPGGTINDRLVISEGTDGTVSGAARLDPTSGYQTVGYLLNVTSSAVEDNLVYLTLD